MKRHKSWRSGRVWEVFIAGPGRAPYTSEAPRLLITQVPGHQILLTTHFASAPPSSYSLRTQYRRFALAIYIYARAVTTERFPSTSRPMPFALLLFRLFDLLHWMAVYASRVNMENQIVSFRKFSYLLFGESFVLCKCSAFLLSFLFHQCPEIAFN